MNEYMHIHIFTNTPSYTCTDRQSLIETMYWYMLLKLCIWITESCLLCCVEKMMHPRPLTMWQLKLYQVPVCLWLGQWTVLWALCWFLPFTDNVQMVNIRDVNKETGKTYMWTSNPSIWEKAVLKKIIWLGASTQNICCWLMLAVIMLPACLMSLCCLLTWCHHVVFLLDVTTLTAYFQPSCCPLTLCHHIAFSLDVIMVSVYLMSSCCLLTISSYCLLTWSHHIACLLDVTILSTYLMSSCCLLTWCHHAIYSLDVITLPAHSM